MDPIKDIQSGVTTGILDRLRNPLVGSFALSWCLYNWEIFPFIAAFGDVVEYRIEGIKEVLARPLSFYAPATFALGYFVAAPWLWLALRRYQELPESRIRTRHRLQREDNLLFENQLAEKETRLLLLRQQKLQSEREIALVRDKINSYFDQAYETAQATYQAKLDQVLLNVEQLERDVLPRLSEDLTQKFSEYEKLQRLVSEMQRPSFSRILRLPQDEVVPQSSEGQVLDSSSANARKVDPHEPSRPLTDAATLRALNNTAVEEADIPAFLRKAQPNEDVRRAMEDLHGEAADQGVLDKNGADSHRDTDASQEKPAK